MDGPSKAKMTDENDEETEEICEQGRTYVTGICEGKPSFDDGKYHNHCHQCPGFGMCIGDYRYLSQKAQFLLVIFFCNFSQKFSSTFLLNFYHIVHMIEFFLLHQNFS